MATASFTFDDMIYNTVVNGQLKTISYVKLMKDTRQMQVVCQDGDVFLANQDDSFLFEVNTPKPKMPITLSKIKRV